MDKLDFPAKLNIVLFLIVLICIGFSGRELWDKIYIIVMLICWFGSGFFTGLRLGEKNEI